jgi:hypothetical protein
LPVNDDIQPMNEQQQPDDRRKPSPGLSAASVSRWLNGFFDMIARAVTGQERREPDRSMGQSSVGPNGLITRSAAPRRSLVGYINSGLYKMEQARRTASMIRQYQNALHTISLTRRAIRKAPHRSKHLFKGYSRVLADAKRRVKIIYQQMRHTEAHLRRYNPHSLDDEITRLERSLAAAATPTARAETEMILEARRDMLSSLLTLDDKLAALSGQLGNIAAALELNHVRVISISSHSVQSNEADLLHARMLEVTEQLTLLEESLRELNA